MNNNIARVNMVLDSFNIDTLQCSQGDTEGREFGFILMDGDTGVDISNIVDPVFREFDVYKNGTEEILPSALLNGVVDLGSLNWAYDSSVPRFTSSDIASAVAVPSSNSNIANIKCAVYDSISLNGLPQSNKCIAVSTGGVISVKDMAYTSAPAFKSAMSGVLLYYEKIDSTPATSPIIADIKYPQGELTDQEFFYRESPTEEDGLAKLTRIKGNTLAFNQLAPTLASGNYNANRSTIAYSNNVATVTTNGNDGFGFYRSMATVVGHTYLFTAKVKPSKVGSLRLGLDEDSAVGNRIGFSSTAEKTVSRTWTCATANSPLVCYYYNNSIASGDNYTITNLMVIDLTLMGLTSVQFESYFPLPYYSYQSTLLPFKGTSIKTVGKNLLENKGVASINLSGVITTKNDDGSITVNGTANGNNVYSFNSTQANVFDFVLPSGNYKMVLVNGGANDGQVGIQRSGVNSYVYTNANGVANFTVQNGDLLRIAFYVTSGKTYNTTLKAMICSADADSTYEPYTSYTTDLPTLTYFPNGMKSAGNAYDELLPNKAITRIGMVNLGDLNWAYSTNAGHERFNAPLSDAKKPATANDKANLICAIYENATNNETFSHTKDKTIAIGNTGQVYVYDSAYTNATAFKTAMNGVYLYYELATPTETDISTATLVTERGEIPLYRFGSRLYGDCTKAVSKHPGIIDSKIRLINSDGVAYSNKVMIRIERSTK